MKTQSNKNVLSQQDYEWMKEQNKKSGHDWQPLRDMELDCCARCGALEGGTPTHCPGKFMSSETANAVYEGKVDYREGQWVNQPTIHMGHIYGIKREPLRVVEVA